MIRCLILLLFSFSTVGCTQSNIANNRGAGYIFPKEQYANLDSVKDFSERFTPSIQDVSKVEELIRDQIKDINTPLKNQGHGCPVIHRSLWKYKRQYVGYLNANGERIVWVNFIWKGAIGDSDALKKEVFLHFDGCSRYWNIKVNITKGILYDLFINAPA